MISQNERVEIMEYNTYELILKKLEEIATISRNNDSNGNNLEEVVP